MCVGLWDVVVCDCAYLIENLDLYIEHHFQDKFANFVAKYGVNSPFLVVGKECVGNPDFLGEVAGQS